MRILIVEDEKALADLIQNKLKKENYTVDIALDGEDGLYKSLSNIYDLIILDIMLPKKNGFEILKEVKENNIDAHVIMLTAKASLDDKLECFEYGADDYLTKPFHLEELLARVNARLRKKEKNGKPEILEFEDISLNIKTTKLICTTTNDTIDIVCKEFLILEYLMQNPNQIIAKDILYDKIWGIDNNTTSNNLEAYISFIRKKLKAIDSKVNIKAIRGLGYKLEVFSEEVME